MKYVTFKNHIYKRLLNEFGFKKVNREYYYDSDEVRIFFNIDKSQYSNVAIVRVWLSVDDFLKVFNRDRPENQHFADTIIPIEFASTELDNLESFDKINKQLNDFFINIFPTLLESESVKQYFINNNIKPTNTHLAKFWGI